jgi:anti-sigma factor RsiW
MDCDLFRDKIEPYLDAELPESQERDTFRHISDCQACGQEALALLHTKRMVKTAGMKFTPSAEFRRRVLGAEKTQEHRWYRMGWVLATAALVLVIGAAAMLYRPASRASEFADLHVSMLASANPFDVVSTDKHTVKPWFQGKIPFAFDLPDLPDEAFVLAGGRLAYLEGAPAAELIYNYGKHRVSVFVTEKPQGRANSENIRGFHVVSWQRNGLGYTAVSDASEDAVRKLAAIFQK